MRRATTAGALASMVMVCGVACRQSAVGAPEQTHAGEPAWFADVTTATGLSFVHDPGPAVEKYFFPQIIGSGVALVDFDNDGRLDIYVVNNGGPGGQPNRLFRQRGDGTFSDVSAGSGLDVAGWGMGVAIGDIDNDGWPDLLLTEYGRLRMFLNKRGTFRDVTADAGLESPLWGTSATFLDYDRDGWLDLVVANYVDYDPTKPCGGVVGRLDYCGPHAFPGSIASLFHNRGRPGTHFDDVTLRAGVGRASGAGLGVVAIDFNGDRWPDILVANDGEDNHLWINRHDGTFEQEALLRGIAYDALGRAQANMGIATGDVDGDGLLDVFIPHLPEELPVLWQQGPAGLFRDVTVASGLAAARWRATGFGAVLADFDLDGAVDLAVVNGAVHHGGRAAPPGGTFWDRFTERNQVFVNDGHGRFRDVSIENSAFTAVPRVARGLAAGDLDNDGALDLVETAIASPVRVFRNVAPRRGHWLLVRAIDPALGGRDAYGSELVVKAGGRRWTCLVNPGSSYASSNDPRAHVGLGSSGRIDAIDVTWPDGTTETFGAQPADRAIVLRKGESAATRGAPHP